MLLIVTLLTWLSLAEFPRVFGLDLVKRPVPHVANKLHCRVGTGNVPISLTNYGIEYTAKAQFLTVPKSYTTSLSAV